MIALIIGILVSFIVTIVGTPLLIRLVHRLHYGQYIRQDGPQSHQVKRGTPTLGGVVINLAIAVVLMIATLLVIRAIVAKKHAGIFQEMAEANKAMAAK